MSISPPKAADPAGAQGRTGPSAVTVKSMLMQDAVGAEVVSVRRGGLNSEALFPNPFLGGKQEALIIDEGNRLTHLQRSTTSATGWRQKTVGAISHAVQEVVTLFHQADESFWAACRGPSDNLVLLKLIRNEAEPSGTWQVMPKAIRGGKVLGTWRNLFVSYSPGVGAVLSGLSRLGSADLQMLRMIRPTPAVEPEYWLYSIDGKYPQPLGEEPAGQPERAEQSVPGSEVRVGWEEGIGGYITADVYTGLPSSQAWYLRDGTLLRRFWAPPSPHGVIPLPTPVATDVAQIVGSYYLPFGMELGCVYLATNGDVVTWHRELPQGRLPNGLVTRLAVGFKKAASWQDANGMMHIYGLDRDNTLKVVHQVGWMDNKPVWAQAADKNSGRFTTVVIGLHPMVAGFSLDSFPDYTATELIRMEGVPAPDAYCICTQDSTTSLWSRDNVRLPGGAPHVVSRYVSDITLADGYGAPMPDYLVSVSAESLIEIQSGGVSYLVGSGHAASLKTDGVGKVTVAVIANGLAVPNLHLDAAGLANGAVIQPNAEVSGYLAGTGTITTQQGLFTAKALADATVNGRHITRTQDLAVLGPVVKHCADSFALAAGQPLPPRSVDGSDGPQEIFGYAIGCRDSSRPYYQAFRTQADHDAYLASIRAADNYGGLWDDFWNWAGDVWEGIKDGVVHVAEVVVSTVTSMFIKIGDAIVELISFVIDTVEKACHVIEAVVQTVVDEITLVLDWLKALFDFKDIWDTKTALQASVATVAPYITSTLNHLANQADNWFEQKDKEVIELIDGLKARYSDTRLGDFPNKGVPIIDSAGSVIAQQDLASPQGNWMLDQFTGQLKREPQSLLLNIDAGSPVIGAFTGLWEAIQSSGTLKDLVAVVERVGDALIKLFDFGEQSPGNRVSFAQMLDLCGQLISALLKAIDGIFKAFIKFGVVVVDNLDAIFNAPISLGPVNVLYAWIQTQAGVRDPEAMTASGLVFLMAAFMGTTAYKLIMGADNPPFPGGTFPRLPPPPWDPSYSAAGSAPDPYRNQQIVRCQAGFGAINGTLGALWVGLSDLAILAKPTILAESGADPWLAINLPNCLLGFISGPVMTCPPMIGADWDTPALGTWLAACLFNISDVVTSLVGPAIPVIGKSTAFKNLGVWVGTVMSTVVGGIQLSCNTAHDDLIKQNNVSFAADVIGVLPACPMQVVRLVAMLTPWRVPAVTAVSIADAIMTAVASWIDANLASWELQNPPWISPEDPPPGRVNQPYTFKFEGHSGGGVAQGGLVNWSCSPLPPGLTFDQKTATISGTPTEQPDHFWFIDVSVWDEYLPPLQSTVRFALPIRPE